MPNDEQKRLCVLLKAQLVHGHGFLQPFFQADSWPPVEMCCSLADVEYEELPAVFDPEQAMQDGAPQLWEGTPNNIAKNPVFAFGDLEAGFAEADHIFEGVYQTQRVHTCYMEPRVCVAESDTQGRIKIISSMQHAFGLSRLYRCFGR